MDIKSLVSAVLNAAVGTGKRINDLSTGTVLTLNKVYPHPDDEKRIMVDLVNDKKQRFTIGVTSFAAMRITDEPEKIKEVKWSTELRDSDLVQILKEKAQSDEGCIKDNMQFEIVHRAKIVDTFAEGEENQPQLRMNCYKGFKNYLQRTTEIRNDKNMQTDADARNSAYQQARMTLYSSGVRDEKFLKEDKYYTFVPVFIIKA